ncbi:MAG: hypothetical protein EAZ74_06875 [Alphaproteobacteria bacterium]|nr:MAG: hypothetical protein EAZ74_06875 [Alphaproteobacteria bacterium]
MHLRFKLSEEELSKGFDESTDIFHNHDLADRVTELFKNLSGGTVCLLDGKWGTGKTTFVRQWSSHLSKSDIPNVYFNSFASDYIDTPFTALAGMFIRAARDAKKQDDPALANFLEKAAKVGKALAATTAKVGLKAATLGALDGASIQGMAEAVAEGLGEIVESSVKNLLEEHAERETQFQAMRDAFSQLALTLTGEANGEIGRPPLIIFVDELDRCRPDFSLGILEILKHFFNVDGVHFVLVTNKSYLESAVAGKYGFSGSSSEYLEKFYDFIVIFDLNYDRHNPKSTDTFIKNNLNRLVNDESNDAHEFKQTVKKYCTSYRLTLRQIENVCINACLAYLSVKSLTILKHGYLIAFAATMKAIDYQSYKKLRSGHLSWKEAEAFIKKGSWEDNYGDHISVVMQWYLDTEINPDDDKWHQYRNSSVNYHVNRLNTLSYISNNIIERFS